MHVLDRQRRESGLFVDARFGERRLDQGVDGVSRGRRPGERTDVQHADQRACRAEAFVEHRLRVPAVLRGKGHGGHLD